MPLKAATLVPGPAAETVLAVSGLLAVRVSLPGPAAVQAAVALAVMAGLLAAWAVFPLARELFSGLLAASLLELALQAGLLLAELLAAVLVLAASGLAAGLLEPAGLRTGLLVVLAGLSVARVVLPKAGEPLSGLSVAWIEQEAVAGLLALASALVFLVLPPSEPALAAVLALVAGTVRVVLAVLFVPGLLAARIQEAVMELFQAMGPAQALFSWKPPLSVPGLLPTSQRGNAPDC